MRLLLDDIISELQRLLHDTKSPRNRVLLESALSSLNQYKKVNERKSL